MSSTRLAKISLAAAIVLMVVSVAGFTLTLILNAFVLDKYNAYGEVPIPGSDSMHLPAGEVTVSFHAVVIGSPAGGGLPVPRLGVGIEPPAGVPEPTVTESYGSTTTINNDAHVRVWVVQVPAEGTYNVKTEGQVSGYISPRLAFGHKTAYGSVVWAFVVLFGIGLLNLICALWWSARARSSKRPVVTAEQPVLSYTPTDPAASTPAPEPSLSSHTPADEGIKLEQLKTLASLRDSGALTDAEFEAEKRRILDRR
jgi:putative oligomerization/nucleic acid binding protein